MLQGTIQPIACSVVLFYDGVLWLARRRYLGLVACVFKALDFKRSKPAMFFTNTFQ